MIVAKGDSWSGGPLGIGRALADLGYPVTEHHVGGSSVKWWLDTELAVIQQSVTPGSLVVLSLGGVDLWPPQNWGTLQTRWHTRALVEAILAVPFTRVAHVGYNLDIGDDKAAVPQTGIETCFQPKRYRFFGVRHLDPQIERVDPTPGTLGYIHLTPESQDVRATALAACLESMAWL